jgi:hypothetical protein
LAVGPAGCTFDWHRQVCQALGGTDVVDRYISRWMVVDVGGTIYTASPSFPISADRTLSVTSAI